jgi:hypothetical protein
MLFVGRAFDLGTDLLDVLAEALHRVTTGQEQRSDTQGKQFFHFFLPF